MERVCSMAIFIFLLSQLYERVHLTILSSLKINENMTSMTKWKLFLDTVLLEVKHEVIMPLERLLAFSMQFNFLNLQEINTFPDTVRYISIYMVFSQGRWETQKK